VTIREPDDAERRAVIGMTGAFRAAEAKQITVSLSRLDSTVRAATGLVLPELLERIGPELRDRPAEDAAKARAREDLLRAAAAGRLNQAGWYPATGSPPWRRAR
jgi:hypothetical protein